MNEILILFGEIKRDVQGLKKALAQFSRTHAQRLQEEWQRTPEVMKILGISNRTLNRLIHSGELPVSKIHGLNYFKTSDIEKLLHENYQRIPRIENINELHKLSRIKKEAA